MDTKDIMLKIVGKQLYGFSEEEEQMEFVTEGTFVSAENAVILTYEETDMSGIPGCTTSLEIRGNNVTMKRHGETVPIDTEIRFEKGKRFTGYYDTPYGAMEMEVLTDDVVNNINRTSGKGSLNIDYHISLRGVSESRSRLNIEIL